MSESGGLSQIAILATCLSFFIPSAIPAQNAALSAEGPAKSLPSRGQLVYGSVSKHLEPTTDISWGADGKTIASSGEDGAVIVWNMETGEAVHAFRPEEIPYSMNAVALSTANGRVVATNSFDIWFWNSVSGKLEATEKGGGSLFALSWDGKTLAVSDFYKIWLWDVAQAKKKERGEIAPRIGVNAMAFSRDGKFLAIGDEDGGIDVYEVDKPEKPFAAWKTEKGVRALVFSPNGKGLISAGRDNACTLWSVQGSQFGMLKGHTESVEALALNPEGKLLASLSYDNTIKFWNPLKRELLATLPAGDRSNPYALVMNPEGTLLASGTRYGGIDIWDVKAKKLFRSLGGHGDALTGYACAVDGKTFYTSSWDATVRRWDSLTGREIGVIYEQESDINDLRFHAGKNFLASGANDKAVKVWDLTNDQLAAELKGHPESVLRLAINPAGTILAAGCKDGSICLWDLEAKNQIKRIKAHDSGIYNIEFSTDGALLASAAKQQLRLWKVDGLDRVSSLDGHEGEIYALLFLPDGKTLVSGDWKEFKGALKIWDLETRKCSKTLPTLSVQAIAISEDGKTLATGGVLGTVFFWNTSTWEAEAQLDAFPALVSAVRSLGFGKDGRFFTGAGKVGYWKMWDLRKQ